MDMFLFFASSILLYIIHQLYSFEIPNLESLMNTKITANPTYLNTQYFESIPTINISKLLLCLSVFLQKKTHCARFSVNRHLEFYIQALRAWLLVMLYNKVPFFSWSEPFLEARVEILQNISFAFGRIEAKKNCFWDFLTFNLATYFDKLATVQANNCSYIRSM